jgi:hypothetical protein
LFSLNFYDLFVMSKAMTARVGEEEKEREGEKGKKAFFY